MAVAYNQLNAAVESVILPGVVDLTFKNDPLLAYLRAKRLDTFAGGNSWRENFTYDSLPGGSYVKGQKLEMTTNQIMTSLEWTPKLYYSPVVLYLEDMEIFNAGPAAVVDLADLQLSTAAKSMSARLSVDLYRHGQNYSGDDRSSKINGIAEALSDGATASWDGNTYTTYGGVTRSDVGTALNSNMTTTGANSNLNGSKLTYGYLEKSYNVCCFGDMQPDLGITTNLGMSAFKIAFQPQQVVQVKSPTVGFLNGVQFNSATMIQGQYTPGTAGVNDAKLGNYLASAGETLFWLNTDTWKFTTVASKLFGFGFTGFIPTSNDTILQGRYHWAGNVTCNGPKFNFQAYGISA
jgi:hypothetical protein